MTGERAIFECSHCGATFADAAGLRAHVVGHAERPAECERSTPGEPQVAFACSHCAAVFANRWRLKTHLLGHGVAMTPEYRPPAGSKRRVTMVPVEFSARRHAGPARETVPPDRLAGRRSHRRPLGKSLALVAAALLVAFLGVSTASAWWETSTSLSGTITTGTWGNYLTFTAGSSQATHYSASGCPQSVTIATLDKQGNLSCDFGDALVPSSTSWCDVFRVTSSAPASLKLSFTTTGAIAPLVTSVGFASDKTGGALNSKQTRDVAVQLVVPKTATPGTYAGTLTVAVLGGSESHRSR